MEYTRTEIAFIYAGLLTNSGTNFERFNEMIIKKWSKTTLTKIKKRAWEISHNLSKWENDYWRAI